MSLCKVIAIFDEFRLENVERKLIEHGVHSFTLYPVRGRGRYFDNFKENDLTKYIQMEVYTSDDYAESLCRLISGAAQRGEESQGLVSVIPVQSLLRIRDKIEIQEKDFSIEEIHDAFE